MVRAMLEETEKLSLSIDMPCPTLTIGQRKTIGRA